MEVQSRALRVDHLSSVKRRQSGRLTGRDTGISRGGVMRIGFIGLGNMGLAMAGNLVRAGHALTVYNRTPGREAGLPAPGARAADTPRDLAADAEVIVTMLADDEALMATMFGVDGA